MVSIARSQTATSAFLVAVFLSACSPPKGRLAVSPPLQPPPAPTSRAAPQVIPESALPREVAPVDDDSPPPPYGWDETATEVAFFGSLSPEQHRLALAALEGDELARERLAASLSRAQRRLNRIGRGAYLLPETGCSRLNPGNSAVVYRHGTAVSLVGYWKLDFHTGTESLFPFLYKQPMRAGVGADVPMSRTGKPCHARWSDDKSVFAWEDGVWPDPPRLCVARKGETKGTCYRMPRDPRPAIRRSLDAVMASAQTMYHLREEANRRWCQAWDIEHEEGPKGRIPKLLKGTERVGNFSYESRRCVHPSQNVGFDVGSGSTPLLDRRGNVTGWVSTNGLIPVTVQVVTRDVILTSSGPWYLTQKACEAMMNESSPLVVTHSLD